MTTRPPQILVVDDEPDIRYLISEILGDFNYAVTAVHDAAAARSAVRLQQFDAILLDIWMPGDDGITLLKEWFNQGLKTPVIMLSAHGSVETAVEATRYGAFDYLEKPVSVGRLEITVRNAIRNSHPPVEYTIKSKPVSPGLVGSSQAMSNIRSQIKKISQLKTNVMIIGEIGSGRTTLARMLHLERGKEMSLFKVLDWQNKESWQQSISEVLDKSSDGTLLVRDLHTYNKYSQNQILGLLDAVAENRLNDSNAGIPNVIATATKSVYERVRQGKLRPELTYRLNESLIEVPPLRDRLEDIPELVGYLVDEFSRAGEIPYKRISTAGLNCLRNHSWKGNVQELKNVLIKAIHGASGETIGDSELQVLLENWEAPEIESLDSTEDETNLFGFSFREAKENFEREYLRHHLLNCDSITEVAKVTGLHRASIFRKTRELGIDVAVNESSDKNTSSETES